MIFKLVKFSHGGYHSGQLYERADLYRLHHYLNSRAPQVDAKICGVSFLFSMRANTIYSKRQREPGICLGYHLEVLVIFLEEKDQNSS